MVMVRMMVICRSNKPAQFISELVFTLTYGDANNRHIFTTQQVDSLHLGWNRVKELESFVNEAAIKVLVEVVSLLQCIVV
jgi:hypothetical protein